MKPARAYPRISLEKILYATDFSRQSNEALPYALSLAHRYGSTLFAVHVVSMAQAQVTNAIVGWQAIAAQAVREAEETMAGLEPQIKGVPHEILVRKGEVWRELSTVIREKDIDLVIVGTHGRMRASKLLMGSVAEKIFRHASCPVLTVGPNVSGEPEGIVDLHTILFPTDFSPESFAAVPYAVSLAQENQARLYLLHVTPGPVSASVESSLQERLNSLVPPEAELWCTPKPLFESGNPAQKILDLSQELAVDLIVLGTKPVARLAGTVSHVTMATAYKVVSQAICPVFTVRGPE
jgi:nucleotide-binding universal stress UspA family protein